MTDIRDRDTRTLDTPVKEASLRSTLVSRALSPIRRVTSRDLAPVSERALDPGEVDAPRRKTLVGKTLIGKTLIGKTLVASDYLRLSALIVVILPMLATGIYLFFIASDQYVAEARFAVRQAQSEGSKDLSSNGGGTSAASTASSIISGTVNLGGEDAEIVANYIHSRAIVEDISGTVDLREIFARPEADVLARLSKGVPVEDLVRYWNRMVSVYIESTSGIVTVSVSAFRREDALALVSAIVASSERLVNSMSLKMRLDTIKTAEDEVRRAEGEYRFSMANLTAFRNSEHLVDPVEQSKSTSKLVLSLMADKIETESKLFVALRVQGPTAPGVSSLRAKLEVDNNQITDLKEQLAGDKDASNNMANALSQFESLELNTKFAERMYGFARDGVERARIASIRQQIYLAVFVPPSLPQDFTYPARVTDFLLISLVALMTWLSGVIISASVLDHRL